MLSLQDLKDYCKVVGIKAHHSCREKSLREKISRSIDVSIDDVDDIILGSKNKEEKKVALAGVLFKEKEPDLFEVSKVLKVRVMSDHNYEIEGLLLKSKEVVILPKFYIDNQRFMKKINRQIEIKKIEWVN